MNRSAPMVLAGLLALIAFGALGYSAWAERAKRINLQTRYDALQTDVERLNDEISAQQRAIYDVLLSEETENLLQRIVTSDDPSQRAVLGNELDLELLDFYVQYGAAPEIFGRLEDLVAAPTQAERQDIRDRFLNKVYDMSPGPREEPFVGGSAADAKTISTLITSLIALGTALGSVITYVTSGGQRRVDEALAEVQLEKAQIELAQMRYDARKALDYMHGNTAEDPS